MFTGEQKVLEPGSCNVVSLGVNTEIPKGFFWKIYRHSGQLINHFVGCDCSIIDFGYQGIVNVIMVNYSKVPFQVCIGQRIAQIIFHKIENYFSKSWCIVKFRKTIWRFWFYRILILLFLVLVKMSFVEVDESKQLFYECYKIIDNILWKGFSYCHCYKYSGCLTVLSYIKNYKIYCCVCQFFSYFELHEVKRFRSYLKQHHENNIARIDEVKPFYSEEHYIWNENIYYTLRNNYLNELIDYLFNLDV